MALFCYRRADSSPYGSRRMCSARHSAVPDGRGVIFGSPLLLALEALGYILPSSQHGVGLAASGRGRGSADCDPDREHPPGHWTSVCLPEFLFLTLHVPDLCDTHNESLCGGHTVQYSTVQYSTVQ